MLSIGCFLSRLTALIGFDESPEAGGGMTADVDVKNKVKNEAQQKIP